MSPHAPNTRELASAIARCLEATASEVPKAMAALVGLTSFTPLGKVDAWERVVRDELLKAEVGQSPNAWKFWRKPARFASWLDLCNWSGWKREAILRTASGPVPNGLFLAFAIRRLNDWVPQVRAAARENILRIASVSDPEHVADALWALLPHCGSWGRMEAEDREVLTSIICLEISARALRQRMLMSTAGPAPIVLAQAARAPVFDSWFEEIAFKAVQPAVRAKAYRFLFERRATWVVGRRWKWTDLKWGKGRFESVVEEREFIVFSELLKLLRHSLDDRSAMVRRVAADVLIRNLASLGVHAEAFVQRLVVDSSASVAERGRFALLKLEERKTHAGEIKQDGFA